MRIFNLLAKKLRLRGIAWMREEAEYMMIEAERRMSSPRYSQQTTSVDGWNLDKRDML